MVNLNAFTVAQATSCTYVEQYESRLMCNFKNESLHHLRMCQYKRSDVPQLEPAHGMNFKT